MSILTKEEIETLLETSKASEKDKNISQALDKAINTTYDFTKLNSKELEYIIDYLNELKNSRKSIEKMADEILNKL